HLADDLAGQRGRVAAEKDRRLMRRPGENGRMHRHSGPHVIDSKDNIFWEKRVNGRATRSDVILRRPRSGPRRMAARSGPSPFEARPSAEHLRVTDQGRALPIQWFSIEIAVS